MSEKETKQKQLSAEKMAEIGGEQKLRRLRLPKDENNTEFLEVIVAIPTRRVMAQYFKYININPDKAYEILVKNCLQTNKDEVLEDDGLFFACVGALNELVPMRDAIIKKY